MIDKVQVSQQYRYKVLRGFFNLAPIQFCFACLQTLVNNCQVKITRKNWRQLNVVHDTSPL